VTEYRDKVGTRVVLAGLLIASIPSGAALADDATIAAGREIVIHGVAPGRPGCASCHLQNGAGQPEVGIPRLAGLAPTYVVSQLGYFASGDRRNVAMGDYAKTLSTAQRQEVADYFASLPVPDQTDRVPSTPGLLAQGRELFVNGNYRNDMPACAQCHGVTGLGVGDFSPRLAGQSAAYVADKLTQWHGGDIRDPNGAFMRAEASHLDQAGIEAVAAYVASLGDTDRSKP